MLLCVVLCECYCVLYVRVDVHSGSACVYVRICVHVCRYMCVHACMHVPCMEALTWQDIPVSILGLLCWGQVREDSRVGGNTLKPGHAYVY